MNAGMCGRGEESESESEGDIDVPLHHFPHHFHFRPTLIRAFLFDIGNVLLKFDFTATLRAVAEHSEVRDEIAVLAGIDRVKLSYEDGQIDRAAFLRGVFDVLRYRGTEAQFVAAWEDIFTPNEPMFALVAQLAQTHPLFLLSNTSDIHRDYIFRTYDIFRSFTAGTYSFSARTSKPGRAIYEHACREHGLVPATTFFIDDLLPNIETARSLGFVVHHYHLDRHGALLADLRSVGV
jgi:putative hydrolase of the HAD superfamily